jgi:hypothetical protein
VNRFKIGEVVATPGALAALEASGESLLDYVQRHVSGDWGVVKPEDRRENEVAIILHMRIMSVYLLKSGMRIWIITEADRTQHVCDGARGILGLPIFAGRPTKAQFVKVYGPQGPKMTWEQRAKAGTAPSFRSGKSEGCVCSRNNAHAWSPRKRGDKVSFFYPGGNSGRSAQVPVPA